MALSLAVSLALAALAAVVLLAVRSSLRQRALVRRVGLRDDPRRLPFVGNVFHSIVLGGYGPAGGAETAGSG